MLIVRGLTSNYDAQTDQSVEVPACCRSPGSHRQFKGAGHPDDRDRIARSTKTLERVRRSADQPAHHKVIPAARNDRHSKPFGAQPAFDRLCQTLTPPSNWLLVIDRLKE